MSYQTEGSRFLPFRRRKSAELSMQENFARLALPLTRCLVPGCRVILPDLERERSRHAGTHGGVVMYGEVER